MANQHPDDPGHETTPPDAGQGADGGGGAPDPHPAEEAVGSVERAAEAVRTAAGDDEPDAAAGAQGEAQDGSVELPDFGDGAAGDDTKSAGLTLLSDVALHVQVELGRTQMLVEDVLRLSSESVIELDKAAGDPVDIYVNNRHVARGEVLVLNENFCVRVSEIVENTGPEE